MVQQAFKYHPVLSLAQPTQCSTAHTAQHDKAQQGTHQNTQPICPLNALSALNSDSDSDAQRHTAHS